MEEDEIQSDLEVPAEQPAVVNVTINVEAIGTGSGATTYEEQR